MKRLIISITFILLIFCACTFEQVKVDRVYDNICATLDKAIECSESGNYKGAYDSCCELDKYFQKEYKCLSLMLYNNRLNDFNVTLHELKSLAKNEDSTLNGRLLGAKIQAEQIKTNQKITFENIL